MQNSVMSTLRMLKTKINYHLNTLKAKMFSFLTVSDREYTVMRFLSDSLNANVIFGHMTYDLSRDILD